MKTLLIYPVTKEYDNIVVIGAQGYIYDDENLLEKNKGSYKGFLNTDKGYLPTDSKEEFNFINVDEYIEIIAYEDNIETFISNLKDRYSGMIHKVITVSEFETLSNNIGIDIATNLVTIGLNRYINGNNTDIYNSFPATKYWKPDIPKHSFINFKQLFTISNEHIPGEYGIMKYDSEFEIGRKQYDAAYGFTKLSTPDKNVELLIDFITKKLKDLHTVLTIDIRIFYSNDIYFYFSKYGLDSLVYNYNNYRHTVKFLGDIPVIYNLYPIGLGYYAMDNIMLLKNIYKLSKKPGKAIKVIDITDRFYIEKETKKGKALEFRKELNNNDVVDVEYLDNRDKKYSIKMKINTDTIERNSLKRLETLEPKISLVIVEFKNDTKIEWYTVIETMKDNSYIVWCSFYTNTLIK